MTEHTPRMIKTHGATFTVADEERYRGVLEFRY